MAGRTYSGLAYETKGQHLAWYLRENHLLLSGADRGLLEQWLSATSAPSRWTDAIHQMVVLHSVRQLVASGKVIWMPDDPDNPVVHRELGQMIFDSLNIDYRAATAVRERLKPAIKAAKSHVTGSTKQALRGWAEREFKRCYLCGAELDFGDPEKWTADHVWPQAFGGDSEIENLLPACAGCNEAKGYFADWALYPIQANIVGFRMNPDEIAKIPGQLKYSVLAHAAGELATHSRCSLKEAYVRLSPFAGVTVVETSRAVDVFNLAAI